MEEQINNLSEEDRTKLLSLINEKREQNQRIHSRLSATGEELRFYEQTVHELSLQRNKYLEQSATVYKKCTT